jgi:hypothetical protein
MGTPYGCGQAARISADMPAAGAFSKYFQLLSGLGPLIE